MRGKISMRRGSSLFVLFGIISVLFIFGVSFFFLTSQQVGTVRMMEARIKAHYIAESALEKALFKIQAEFSRDLVHHEKSGSGEDVFEINAALLDLIDVKRIVNYARIMTFEQDELMPGAKANVIVQVMDVRGNDFYTFIDYQEKIPENMKVHQKPRDAETTLELEPLGGINARIRFISTGSYANNSITIDTVKSLSINDITPPAPDHTLFIQSEKREYLKKGVFELSNLDLPPVIMKLLQRLSTQVQDYFGFDIGSNRDQAMDLIRRMNIVFNDTFDGEGLDSTLKMINELSKIVTDDHISETVDNIILSLSPRNWGRVRTNGRLDVYMPFFAADDIINYFAETGSWRELPEVGYLFSDNRLHDPYMSVYTHYEGLIYKHYRKIYPSQFGIMEPEEVPPEQYTINTRLEYPRRYPHRLKIENLERLRTAGLDVAKYVINESVNLKGTKEQPIALEGIWWFRGGLSIEGVYSGRGLLVSEKPIRVGGDLLKNSESDSIALVSLWDELVLNDEEIRMESAIYAHKGLRAMGCKNVVVHGNLAVEELNRERMPEAFRCRFDYNIKNHMVDNLHGYFSDRYLYFRNLTLRNIPVLETGASALPEL
jgi:hypothetical protein